MTLEWQGDSIQVFHTPGHTHGSVCYHFGNIAFTGDTILNQMIVRMNLPGSNLDLLSTSITKLLEELPSETWLFQDMVIVGKLKRRVFGGNNIVIIPLSIWKSDLYA